MKRRIRRIRRALKRAGLYDAFHITLIALGIAAVVMLAMVFLAVILFVAAVAVDIASEFMD